MHWSRTSLPALFIALLCASISSAQLKSNLSDPVDPFSIRPGEQFSASGSGVNATGLAKVNQITSDIAEAERLIRSHFVDSKRVSNAEMTAFALDGALRVLDPHSRFYAAKDWAEMLEEEASTYSGIGASISNFTRRNITDTYVVSTASGSPAERAGLKFGDKIVAINGLKMSGRASHDVRDLLRGSAGSNLRLTIERANLRTETIDIRRGRVAQPSVPDAYVIRPGVGYIQLSEGFASTTNDEVGQALRRLKQDGIKSLILDLRGNGGGIVEQAVKVAERFLPSGSLILSQKGRTRFDNRVWKSANSSHETMPLVVLVDKHTASASEIVAGALQDNDRALIVGETTFGKGLVQSILDLPNNTGIALTTGRYLTPSGRSLQRDYTQVDNYEYFEHRTPVAAIDKPMVAMKTLTDRTVFAGDGITPDELVGTNDAENAAMDELADPLFFYVRETLSDASPVRFENAVFGSTVDPVAGFLAFVKTDPAWRAGSRSILNRSERIRTRIRYEITLATEGPRAAAHLANQEDELLARAIDALPRSRELAAEADKTRRQRRP